MLMTHRQERTPLRMIQITDDNGQHLGYAAGVIELSSEMGGKDPRAPLAFSTLLVRGQLVVGHTFDLNDETEPIYYPEGQAVQPGKAGYADFRCPFCVTHATVSYDDDGHTFMILEHKRGCRWLNRIHAEHGRPVIKG
jgi:hypothetical protein